MMLPGAAPVRTAPPIASRVDAPDEARRPSPAAPLSANDLRWLNRVTFGIDSVSVARYRALGRVKYLDEQLSAALPDPPALAAAIATFRVSRESAQQLLRWSRDEDERIRRLEVSVDEKLELRNVLRRAAGQPLVEARKRHLMRALHSPAQLQAQMTWFWMNHFSVFAGKADPSTVGEYEEQQIRPQALGRFRDLVMATVTAPAMLQYLDNAQSSVGRVNENYARELMELHVLGVSGGSSGSQYSQADVQELARVLTGAGLNFTETAPTLTPEQQPFYVRHGLFEFNPARHDFGPKTILGQPITAAGLPEIEQAVTRLCQQPAAARFISQKLATYFVADVPPPSLVEAMVEVFKRSDGNIGAVLRTMFLAREFEATVAGSHGPEKLKDPMQFVISSLRLAYDGQAITNYLPVINWLTQLGELPYGRVTPDGYELTEDAWTSSGQMVRRFEIARAIGTGGQGLFTTEDNKPGPTAGFPMLNNRLFYDAIEPALSRRTREALAQTLSQNEWNTVLLASPDWMHR